MTVPLTYSNGPYFSKMAHQCLNFGAIGPSALLAFPIPVYVLYYIYIYIYIQYIILILLKHNNEFNFKVIKYFVYIYIYIYLVTCTTVEPEFYDHSKFHIKVVIIYNAVTANFFNRTGRQ